MENSRNKNKIKGKSFSQNRNNKGRGNAQKRYSERKDFKNKKEDEMTKRNREIDMTKEIVYGRNVVYELLEQGVEFSKIYIEDNINKDKAKEKVFSINNSVNVEFLSKDAMKKYGDRHQGIVGIKKPFKYSTITEIIEYADEKGEKPLIVILDKIMDPNNLGAIIRSAEIFGVHGIIIPKHSSAKVTDVVYKVSASAVNRMRVAEVTNINYLIDDLKKEGFWFYAADMDGDKKVYELDVNTPLCLIVGSEGEGVSKLTLEKSDFIFKIPMLGKTESLNVSVSAAICMYEFQKLRGKL